MVEAVAPLLPRHAGDDDRRTGLDREPRPTVAHVRRTAEEFHGDIRPAHAQVGENREGPSRLEALLDLHKCVATVAVQHLDVSILLVHPRIQLRIALAGGDRKERQPVLRHRPGRHVPVARMRHHDDDAAALVDELLEEVLVMRPVLHVTVHPAAVQLRRAHHLNAVHEDVLQRPEGDRPHFGLVHLREDTPDAFERPAALEAKDAHEQPAEAPRQCHRQRIGQGVEQRAERPQRPVFDINCDLPLCHSSYYTMRTAGLR